MLLSYLLSENKVIWKVVIPPFIVPHVMLPFTMILPISSISPILFLTLSLTTALGTKHPILSLNVNPLPNPYLVPSTRITLVFDPHAQPLSAPDVIDCIRKAREDFLAYMRLHGDGVVTDAFNFDYRSVRVRISPAGQPARPLMYNDTLAVLEGVETKMAREGYWRWYAFVRETEGLALLGAVVVHTYGPP